MFVRLNSFFGTYLTLNIGNGTIQCKLIVNKANTFEHRDLAYVGMYTTEKSRAHPDWA